MISSRGRAVIALLSLGISSVSVSAQVLGPPTAPSPTVGKKLTPPPPLTRLFPKRSAAPTGGVLHPGPGQTDVSPQVAQQIAALMAEKKARTPAQRKISSQLLYAARMWAGKPIAPGVTKLGTPVQPDIAGRADVDIKATVTPALLNYLRSTGAQIRSAYPRYGIIHAKVGLNWLEVLAGRTDIRAIKVANRGFSNEGLDETEGVVTHQSDVARKLYGITGLGSKVGVLSTSDSWSEDSVATGDLPDDYEVLPGQDGRAFDGGGEGTAMMEIVHDMAPSSSIAFATAFESMEGFADNVRGLFNIGCNVLVDDVIFFAEAPFQDDIIAQAVNDVTAGGGLYFSAAGNLGSKAQGTAAVWEGDFRDGGPATLFGLPNARLHRFVEGGRALNYNVNFFALGFVHWSDPMGGSANDYDVFLVDFSGKFLMAASTDLQDGTQDPFEFVFDPFLFNDRLYVVQNQGAEPRALRINSLFWPQDFTTNAMIWGHAAAADAFAVSAIDEFMGYPYGFDAGDALTPESFTSDGPRHIFYYPDGTPVTPGNYLIGTGGGVVRAKPEITATDGVTTYVPGFTPFFGTSAAAPHAAAIAATLLEVNPYLNRGELAELFSNTAVDLMTPGWDDVTGAGVIMTQTAATGLVDFVALPSILISNITATSADIAWKTPISADSFVTLTDPNGNTLTFSDSNAVLNHALPLTGLAPGTLYTVDVESVTPTGSVYGFQTTTLQTLSATQARLVLLSGTGVRDFARRRIVVTATLGNELFGAASNVKITGATLSAMGTVTPLPVNVGTIAGNGSKSFVTEYPLQRATTEMTLRVRGTYVHLGGQTASFQLAIPVTVN